MNGGADLGGMMGLGPIVAEPDEPNFHAAWEARALGMIIALGACGQWNIDVMRHERESLPPADYLRRSYYSIWIQAAVNRMIEQGMITASEWAEGKMTVPPVAIRAKLEPQDVEQMLLRSKPYDRPAPRDAVFQVGDQIRTINNHPSTHTRMARYARDKIGTITKVHGCHVFPDSNAHGAGEDPQWLYQVTFSARVLWGDQGNPIDTVSLDLWEPYLRAMT